MTLFITNNQCPHCNRLYRLPKLTAGNNQISIGAFATAYTKAIFESRNIVAWMTIGVPLNYATCITRQSINIRIAGGPISSVCHCHEYYAHPFLACMGCMA